MSGVKASALGLRSRFQTYTLLVGVVMGLLIAGLGVPFVFGTPITDSNVAAGASEPPGSGEPSALIEPSEGASGGPGGGPSATGPGGGSLAGDPSQPGLAGDGSGGPGGGSGGGGKGNGGTLALNSSDRGVTAQKVRVGILILDVAQLGQFGIAVPGTDPREQRSAYQAYIDRINKQGGINGREIEPVFHNYDPSSPQSMDVACHALAEDARVFAVLDAGGFQGAAVLCVTDQNETPLLYTGASGTPDEFYEKSDGRLFSLLLGSTRAMWNIAHQLHQLGELKGKTVGILTDERPHQPETAKILEAALGKLGHKVAYTAVLPGDYSGASSRAAVEVQQMRSHGVNAVIKLVNLVSASQFVQNADSQQYFPDYFTADWQNASTDTYAQAMPRSYDGAIGLTAVRTNEEDVDLPEPADSKQCREIFEKATGTNLERGSNSYHVSLRACTLTNLFSAAATKAGANLTRSGFSQAVPTLGEVGLADIAPGTLQPGRYDAVNHLRVVRYTGSCRCYLPKTKFFRLRY